MHKEALSGMTCTKNLTKAYEVYILTVCVTKEHVDMFIMTYI